VTHTTLLRAFALARTGEYRDLDAIEKQLEREELPLLESGIKDLEVRRQIKVIIKLCARQ
jgi:hypothetical protein